MKSFAAVLLVLLCSCARLQAQEPLHLKDLAFSPEQLPACEPEDPPGGDDLPCPFEHNPEYSEDPSFVSCGMQLMRHNLGLKDSPKGEARALLLQAWLDPERNEHEIGMYGAEFVSPVAARAFLEAASPVIAAEPRGPELWSRDSLVALIWNDAPEDSPCFAQFTQRLAATGMKRLVMAQSD